MDGRFGNAATRAIAVGFCIAALGGCTRLQSFVTIPAPAGAIGATFLADDRVAILAGTDTAKSVSVIDLATGSVVRAFGVTKEALGIASDGGDAIIAVGGFGRRGPFGAIERWHLDGTKVRVVPLPARPTTITQSVDGTAYVLLAGRGGARAALPLTLHGLRSGRGVPLETGAHDLQQCLIGSQPYLVYVDRRGAVVVRGTETSTVLHSAAVSAETAGCGDNSRVYAIASGFAARSLTVLSLPSLLQLATVPLSSDARELYNLDNGRLVARTRRPRPRPSRKSTSARITTANDGGPGSPRVMLRPSMSRAFRDGEPAGSDRFREA
jgi:hypothetical protein